MRSKVTTHPVPRKERLVHGVVLAHELRVDHGLYPEADLIQRACAAAIDMTFQYFVVKLLHLPFFGIWNLAELLPFEEVQVLEWSIYVFGFFLYTVLPIARTGQTIGKQALGIRVVTASYRSELSYRAIVVREIVKLAFPPGVLLALLPRDRRSLHDLISRTRVIQYRELEVLERQIDASS